MNALIFVLLAQVASPPLAVVGAPLADDATPQIQKVTKGSIVPYDGTISSDAMTIATAKRIVECEVTNAKLEEGFVISKPILILGITGIVTVAMAIGAGIAVATQKK